MKPRCQLCNKQHDKYTIDLMSATKAPKAFCSDFCENSYKLGRLATDEKEFGYIKCANSQSFKGQGFMYMGGGVVKIEHIFSDGIEISRAKALPIEPAN